MDVQWEDVPQKIADWTPLAKTLAPSIKQALASCYTHGDVGVYFHPECAELGVYARLSPTLIDKEAVDEAITSLGLGWDFLDFEQLRAEPWIKLASTPELPALRRAGIALNFFPGEYAAGIPNAPSPLAATLTGGLVGAGLGYGTGWLTERLMPNNWRRGRLSKALAALGGTVGATPGLAYMYAAGREGHGPLDNSILDADSVHLKMDSQEKAGIDYFVKLAFSPFGTVQESPPRDLISVDVNQLGQTLWQAGANPQTTATTLSTMYAASQLPDPNARPGFVTPNQTGMLGTMMGAAGGGLAGYATGFLVGKTLGVLTGLPQSAQNTMANTGLALGIVNSLVPKLFH
jgi:hypothetical protein